MSYRCESEDHPETRASARRTPPMSPCCKSSCERVCVCVCVCVFTVSLVPGSRYTVQTVPRSQTSRDDRSPRSCRPPRSLHTHTHTHTHRETHTHTHTHRDAHTHVSAQRGGPITSELICIRRCDDVHLRSTR